MKLRTTVAALGLALAVCASVHAQNSKWADPYQKGVKAFQSGKYEEAVALLERAVSADSKAGANKRIEGVFTLDYFPYYYLALAYVELGKFDKAQENLDKARSTLTRQQQAKFAGAEEKTKLALNPPPPPPPPPKPVTAPARSPAFETGLRDAESSLSGKQFDAAIKKFEQLQKLDPAEYGKAGLAARRDVAIKGLAAQLTDEARASLQASRFRDARAKLQQADQLLPGQKPVADLLAAIKKRDDDYQALKSAGLAGLNAKNYAAARDKLQQAQTTQPEQFNTDNLGLRLSEANLGVRLDDATKVAEKTPPSGPPGKADVKPEAKPPAVDPKIAEGQRFAEQARGMIDKGKYADAARLYRSALNADPSNQDAKAARDKLTEFERLRDRGVQLNRKKDTAEALKVLVDARNVDAARFEREGLARTLDALIKSSGDEPARIALQDALLALLKGDAQKSIEILEPAVSRPGDQDAPLHAYLGVAYARQALSAPKPEDRTRWREKAVAQFSLAKAARADYQLSPRIVSPAILSIYASARR